MAKLWGGRFEKKEIDPKVLEFTSSLQVDKVLAKYDCIASRVHVETLLKAGILTQEEKNELLGALDELLAKIEKGQWEPAGHEDVHSAVQAYVEEKAPASGGKLHTARSRNEQVVNDVRLYCKDNLARLIGLVEALQRSLVELAARSGEAIVPGYTHLQQAQPVLFAHLVLAYVEMLERDRARLVGAAERSDVSVMGSGALAGSSLDLDRKFAAAKLAFKHVSDNSIDAVSDRDFMLETVFALSMIAVHLSRVSEDLILYSTSEFGFVEIGEAYCTGSSLMPQKRNADVLELVRGRASAVIGALTTLLTLLKGLPHAYNRDLQEDKKPLFESVETVAASLEIMAGVASTLTLKKNGPAKALENEFIYATDLAEYLVRKGVAFKDAHEAVGKLVKYCVDKNMNISDLSLSELQSFSAKLGEDVYGFLDPEMSVKMKKTTGSTNPALVKKEIAKWQKKLKG